MYEYIMVLSGCLSLSSHDSLGSHPHQTMSLASPVGSEDIVSFGGLQLFFVKITAWKILIVLSNLTFPALAF